VLEEVIVVDLQPQELDWQVTTFMAALGLLFQHMLVFILEQMPQAHI
jgi:hypothetical protein